MSTISKPDKTQMFPRSALGVMASIALAGLLPALNCANKSAVNRPVTFGLMSDPLKLQK